MSTHWIKRFDLPQSDSDLKARLRVLPVPLPDLSSMAAESWPGVLGQHLAAVHLPTVQEVAAIRRLAGIAQAHAYKHYADERMFVEGASSRDPLADEPPFVLVTSLAGWGKSTLAQAIGRVFRAGPCVEVSADLPPFPSVPMVYVKMRSKITEVDVMNDIARSLGLAVTFSKARLEDVRLLRLRLFQRGCSLLVPDELQAITRSGATAQVTKMIAFCGEFGIPVAYICNYSLGHLLNKRRDEEQSRLLSDPLILLPETPDESTFSDLLKDYKVVFGKVLDIDVEKGAEKISKDVEQIHAWTFGLKRSMVRLFVFGFRNACQRALATGGKSIKVTMLDLKSAYESVPYQRDRSKVEACQGLLLGIDPGPGLKDLKCPFTLPPSLTKAQEELADQIRRRQHAAAVLANSMSADEQMAAAELARGMGSATNPAVPPAKELRHKRPPATMEGLVASRRVQPDSVGRRS